MHLHSIAQNHPNSNKMQLLNLHFPVINQLHNKLDIDKLFANLPTLNIAMSEEEIPLFSVIYVSNAQYTICCTVLYWTVLCCRVDPFYYFYLTNSLHFYFLPPVFVLLCTPVLHLFISPCIFKSVFFLCLPFVVYNLEYYYLLLFWLKPPLCLCLSPSITNMV